MKIFIIVLFLVSCGNKNERQEEANQDEIPKIEVTGVKGTLLQEKVQGYCDEDELNQEQALIRIEWAYQCNYISKRRRDYYIYDDKNQMREIPLYPSFYTSESIWSGAPKQIIEANQCFIDKIKDLELIICIQKTL